MKKVSQVENISYRFITNQSDDLSTLTAARTTQYPESMHLINSLKTGECIYIEYQGKYSYPMLVKIDHHKDNKSFEPIYHEHLYIPGKKLLEIDGATEAIAELNRAKRNMQIKQAKAKNPEINGILRKTLDVISIDPLTPMSKLWHQIADNISPTTKMSIMDKLKNLVDFTLIRTGKMNLYVPYIKIEGYEYLGKESPKGLGAGSEEHIFMIDVTRKRGIIKGYEVHIEYEIPPHKKHRSDVCYINGGNLEVFECISTCTKNIISHIKSCLIESDAVSKVTIVTLQKSEHKKIIQIIESDKSIDSVRNKIFLESLETYVKEVWPRSSK
ncbi:MAG: hypothetical protein JW709_12820 [Sedimentisphaerales bacterium]|nr:hypothetical protein [Sedimentisphaerales bacterium]